MSDAFIRISFLFATVMLSVNAEFPYCICQGCQRNQTTGRLFNDTCYFIPLGFTVDPANTSSIYENRYPLMIYNETSLLDSSVARQLVLQLTADYYLLFQQNHISLRITAEPEFPSNTFACPKLDIANHLVYNNCDERQHAIFVATEYERQAKDFYNVSVSVAKLRECSSGNGYYVLRENRCFYYLASGSCPNNSVLKVNSSAAYESIVDFILMELNNSYPVFDNGTQSIVQPDAKTEFKIQLYPQNVSTNNEPNKYFVRTPHTSTIPKCYKVNSLTRRMTRLTHSDCASETLTQPILCEMFSKQLIVSSDDSTTEVIAEFLSENIIFVISGFALLFLVTIIGIVVTGYIRWKANRDSSNILSRHLDIVDRL